MNHKSGFVNIIGRPNVGKSTLMNTLVGEKMSIITSKPQTTRHRIIGIVSDDDYQIVFSDTPGMIQDPSYKMHKAMNRFADSTFEDSDIMLFITDPFEKYADDDPIIKKLQKVTAPLFLIINKTDISTPEILIPLIQRWNNRVKFTETFPISALTRNNTKELLTYIKKYLPEGPAYYPKDQLTDKNERFFASEIIREKILLLYRQEIPYSCEVVVDTYKVDEKARLVKIHATIFVSRNTQKSIMIGKDGSMIKRLGTEARRDIVAFIKKKVYLELRIKVKDNWRNDDRLLQYFGYNN